tara:strand:- start:1707 stop:2414 length:708 start_codon:yes stop_codon:yes gene_type:complete
MKRYSSKQILRTLKKYDLKESTLSVADRVVLSIAEVEDAYALLDDLIEQEERMQRIARFPYWAEVWPASLALARWFCQKEISPPNSWTLELGCGLGLVGIVLAHLGWRIEATDYVEDALIFAAFNAQKNGLASRHRVAYLDWSNPVGQPVDCMVGSDVVYEKKNHPYLNRVLRRLLLPGGRFFLSDPQRKPAQQFCQLLAREGYNHQVEALGVKWKSLEHTVDIHCFTKPLIKIP